jgi:CBS domain-containing protein
MRRSPAARLGFLLHLFPRFAQHQGCHPRFPAECRHCGEREDADMKASDVMMTDVITVTPESDVPQVAALLLTNHISAVPVVDADGSLVGMISEGDLIRRSESGTAHERPWWLQMLMSREALAAEFVREHSRRVGDLMTREVVSASPDTPLADIAALLERRRIKRVPIVKDGRLAGIVSRANLIQALATFRHAAPEPRLAADAELREKVMSQFKAEPWMRPALVNVTVSDGTVDLWGIVDSPAEKQALRVAAEIVPGVKAINDNLVVRRAATGT